ncbi:MAG TPA: PadR family transcriptional regulator [Methanomassiliicoccales archaeon]|jgi:DNA-binding PadR family transcriptional regulator|nr:PadR family transcriptional regulator [Methanomassiliicoccales archaeon]HQN76575.1 PadR family transcriptional regulator [Methanomassiliicoccales archaeon]
MMGKPHTYKGNRISPSQLIMIIKLADRPMYGYELLKALREDYQGVWDPQTGAVYPALRRLHEHGLLSVESKDGKDHYSLTQEGVAWLDETLATMSSGMLFMTRTMEVMGRAYLARKGEVENFIPLDERSPEERLKHLMEAREGVRNNLRMLDSYIAELEKELRK